MLSPGWKQTVAAAENYNDPGNFTAFIAYEWSAAPGGDNLHRVVIYRDNADKALQTLPLTFYQPGGAVGDPELKLALSRLGAHILTQDTDEEEV